MMQRFVVMGVSGCGKSSIGAGVADQIGAVFVDGDDLHPAENVAKMSAGTPLNDDDRAPWLAVVGQALAAQDVPVVIGCSALKRSYRDIIRDNAGGPVTFLFLDGTKQLIAERMAQRKDHFMPPSLLDSQFATLERPEPDESALRVDIDQSPEAIVAELVARIQQD
ncbi:MAG: gluconokinase [Marinosulfonomonas sp.]